MTETPAHLVRFGHPAVTDALDKASALIDASGEVTAAVGDAQPANVLSVALQSLVTVSTQRNVSNEDLLAAFGGALGWVLSAIPDPTIRSHTLQAFAQTAWQSALNGDAAEATAHSPAKGNA